MISKDQDVGREGKKMNEFAKRNKWKKKKKVPFLFPVQI
jgi:hypothetical protein